MSSNLIKKIQGEYDDIVEKEFAGGSLAGALSSISKQFSRSLIFIQEFLQNAEDSGSKFLHFEFHEKKIIIKNNGKSFYNINVKTICKVGRSEKLSDNSKIGQFGIGFKSIFLLSNHVEIHSGKYHFEFNKNKFEKESLYYEGLWMIYPLELDCSTSCEFTHDDLTVFVIYLDYNIKELLEDLLINYNIYFNQKTLLFLHNIQNIKLESKDENFPFYCELLSDFEQNHSNPKIKSIKFLSPTINVNSIIEEYYYLYFEFKEQIKERSKLNKFKTFLSNQYNIKKREGNSIQIYLAFEIENQMNEYQLLRTQGNIQLPLYSYLPFKEFNSYLPFHICSDFITTQNREKLIDNNEWNQLIIKKVAKIFKDHLLPYFMNHRLYKYSWISAILYSFNYINLFKPFEIIMDAIKNNMEIYPIYNSDNEFGKLEELIDVSTFYDKNNNSFLGGLSAGDFQNAFPNKKILDPKVNYSVIKIDDETINILINSLKIKNPQKLDTLIKFKINQIYNDTRKSKQSYIRRKITQEINKYIANSSDCEITDLRELVIPKNTENEEKIDQFFTLTDELKIKTLHKSLRNIDFINLLKEKCNLQTKSINELRPISDLIIEFEYKWMKLSKKENKVNETIKFINEFKEGDYSKIRNCKLELLTFNPLTEEKKWLSVHGKEQIIFPPKYHKKIKSSYVLKKFTKFCKSRENTEIFALSELYLKGNSAHVLENCFNIDFIFDGPRKITGSFGEYLVYKYLQKKQDVNILKKFQKKDYDFKINDNGIDKYIEVKSSDSKFYSATASWTQNETAFIQNLIIEHKSYLYEIYWISNIYEQPILHIIKLDDVKSLNEFQLTINATLKYLKVDQKIELD